ncbi:MAG: YIP1 family protein [Candidatus Thorarchaeota archaeon]
MSKLRCPECLILVGSKDPVCPQCGYRFRIEQFERILPFMKRPERQWESRLTLWQRLWGILRFPSIAFWDIAHEQDHKGPGLIFLGNLVAISLWYVAMVTHIMDATASLMFGFVGIFIVFTLFFLLLNLFYFGIIHIVINLSGREGYFAETFLIGQYALFPLLLANLVSYVILQASLPFAFLSNLSILYLSPVWLVVYGLASVAMLWGAVLLSLGLRERYHFPTVTAFIITMSVTIFVVTIAILVRLTVIPII